GWEHHPEASEVLDQAKHPPDPQPQPQEPCGHPKQLQLQLYPATSVV
ncbi:hypothetical protein Tco_1270814, partial [Tanacetum coccineum]